MKPFQIVGRPVDVERGRPGQRRHEIGVGLGPGVAHRGLVDDLETRCLAVDQELGLQAEGRQALVVGHVLPVIAEVLGGEWMAVRPPVALAQVHGELAVAAHLEALQDVGHDLQVRVIGGETRVAVDRHHAHVLGFGHQETEGAAVAPRAQALAVHGNDLGRRRQTFGKRRQASRFHVGVEGRRFHWRRLCCRRIGGQGAVTCQSKDGHRRPLGRGAWHASHGLSSRASALRSVSTRWPSPRST